MPTSALTSKGQTTIPKEIRDHLHLRPGDRIEFLKEPDGRIVLLPVTLDIRDLFGALPRPRRTVSLKEMDEAVREGARAGLKPGLKR